MRVKLSPTSRWPREDAAARVATRAASAFHERLDESGLARGRVERWLERVHAPVACWLDAARRELGPQPLLVGVHGAQGTGKTTLCALLEVVLRSGLSRRTLVLSLDDYYLGRDERRLLGEHVHPLFRTRGVPGTHDVAALSRTLDRALLARSTTTLELPRFDKARDDLAPKGEWQRWRGVADIVLLEGWCVGSRAVSDAALEEPLNPLERDLDPDATWRRAVNERLAGDYADLFSRLHLLLMLEAPDWASVASWRGQQESELRLRAPHATRTLDEAGLREFLQHYERWTLAALAEMPPRADLVLKLDRQHRFVEAFEGAGRSLRSG